MTVIVTQEDSAMEKEKSQSAIMVSWDEVPTRRFFFNGGSSGKLSTRKRAGYKNITAFYIKKVHLGY